jgi:hypothetical protein
MKTTQRVGFIGVLVASLVMLGGLAQAQVPQLINYQGVLKNGGGSPITGTVSIVFSIYTVPSGGTALWTETQSSVTVTNGLFNVLLGSVAPFQTDPGLFMGTLNANPDRYLGVKVGGDAEMTPRQRLVSVANALKAYDADSLGNRYLIAWPPDAQLRSSNTTDDLTTKISRYTVRHYNNAEEPLYAFGGASTATSNFVAFGGGSATGNAATQLDFFTAPNNVTPLGIKRMHVNGSGLVGIGTDGPTERLHVIGNVRADAFLTPSSRELKKDITPLSGQDYQAVLAQIKDIQMVRYLYKQEENRQPHLGVIAEDAPKEILDPKGKAVSLSDYAGFLLAGLKAQSENIEALKAQIQILESKIAQTK